MFDARGTGADIHSRRDGQRLDRRDGLRCLLNLTMGSDVNTNPTQQDAAQLREVVAVRRLIYRNGVQEERKTRSGALLIPTMINVMVADPQCRAHVVFQTMSLHAEGHHVIVLSNRLKHLEMIKEAIGNDDLVGLFVGSTPERDRPAQASKGIVLATYDMAREGLDVPTLSACVMADPVGEVEQVVGRIQRPCPTKRTPVVCIDIVDPFSIFQGMALKRERLYQRSTST